MWNNEGDLWGQGQALSFHTFSFFVLGQPAKAVETSQRAVELLEQAGDVWEGNMARMMNTWSLYHVGDLKSAYRQMRRVIATSREVGDFSAMAIGLCFWMQIHAQSAPPRRNAGGGGPPARRSAIQRAGDSRPRAGDPVARKQPLGSGEGSARQPRPALGITGLYRTCRAHLLRECGLLATLQGNEQQARTYFDQGIELAEAQGAQRERAKTLLARDEAGLKFGWPGADKQTAEARALVEEIETVEVGESHDDASLEEAKPQPD